MFAALLLTVFLIWFFVEYKNFKDDINRKIKILFENQKQIYNKETASGQQKQEAEKPAEKFEQNAETPQQAAEETTENNTDVSQTNEQPNEEQEQKDLSPENTYEKDAEIKDMPQIIKDACDDKNENPAFENLFMANVFNKIGAIAIVIATFIFLKILSDMGIFTELLKVLTGYAFGLGIIYFAFKTHKENTRNFAEVLMGTGFAVMFTTTFLGCSLLGVIPLWLGVIIGIGLVMTSFLIAEKFNTFSMVAIGLIGGYISPIFTMSETSVNFLFGYLILLNIFSILYVYKNTDKALLNYINILLTVLVVTCYGIFRGEKPILAYPLLLWGAYLINDIMYVKNEKENYNVIKPLNYINYAFLILSTCVIFEFGNKTAIGLTILSSGLIYLLGAYLCKNNIKNSLYIHGFLLSLVIATHFISEDIIRICILSAEAVCLAFFAAKHNKNYLYNWTYAYFGTILAYVCINKGAFFNPFDNPVNWGKGISVSNLISGKALLFGLPSVSALICSKMLTDKNKTIADVLKLLSVSYIYLFAVSVTEVLMMSAETINRRIISIVLSKKYLIYSVIAALYSINIQFMNKNTKMALFQITEMCFYLFSLFLLFSGLSLYKSDSITPFLNLGTAAFLTVLAATLYKKKEYNKDMLSYIAVFLGAIFASCEFGAICKINLSVVWTVYAGIIMIIGIFKNIKVLNISGIVIILTALIKILIIDLQTVSTIYKMGIFLLLGISLMLVSYLYNRLKK
ncbi:MAG: DUF2339 domain-containing protein [Candidatus Gastranaerophilales bacterium]|nr:DUF2339 domain-containing protein [Candidatus Gastranaerophilales bacterium]